MKQVDPWVIEALHHGYHVPFIRPPPLSTEPITFQSYQHQSSKFIALQESVSKMLLKQAIEPVLDQSPGFYSRLFVVPKANGGWRPVIDLSSLNHWVMKTKFKMETPSTVLAALHKNDWMFSIDLQDAYFQVPIHPDSRRYLRFVWQGLVYQFRALCFGLTTAPQVFTRVMAPVAVLAHSVGIRLHRYLDDWLIVASDHQQLTQDKQWLLSLCQQLGLLINMEKSDLIPSQTATYLGMYIDTGLDRVFPSKNRIQRFLQHVLHFREQPTPPAWEWLRLLGHMTSLEKLVPMGRSHMRSLQFQLKQHWSQNQDSRYTKVPLTADILLDIIWWVDPDHLLIGVPLTQSPPDMLLFTDASLKGWGAHLDDLQAAGLWTPSERDLHINMLELKAVWLGLKAFQDYVQGKTVVSMCDNSTVVSHIRHQGGTKSWSLCQRTLQLLQWAHSRQINLRAQYLPGRLNVLADQLSRHKQVLPSEWSLHPEICRKLWSLWGQPHIDMFATALNHRLPVYVSPVPDPQAWAIDAMVQPWDNMETYMYPPTSLLRLVINKITHSQNLHVVLIAPMWPQQEWFPDLLDLLVDQPVTLPLWQSLLKQPHLDRFHLNIEMLNLHAWRLSSQSLEREAFRERLPPESRDLIGPRHSTSTRPNGQSSVVGVVRGRLIQSKPLFLT